MRNRIKETELLDLHLRQADRNHRDLTQDGKVLQSSILALVNGESLGDKRTRKVLTVLLAPPHGPLDPIKDALRVYGENLPTENIKDRYPKIIKMEHLLIEDLSVGIFLRNVLTDVLDGKEISGPIIRCVEALEF